jgi:hypothetical protein
MTLFARRTVVATLSTVCVLSAVLPGAAPATAAAKNTIPGSGTYLVGKDFQAGVYRSASNSSCYWERAKDASGNLNSTIANDIGSGQRLVFVRTTDRVFKTSSCHPWTRVFSSVLKIRSTRSTIVGNGSYLVGSDFRPGTYRSRGNSGSCYWQRSRSADGALGSIIANGSSAGQLVVTISPTDSVFGTSHCATWTRIG